MRLITARLMGGIAALTLAAPAFAEGEITIALNEELEVVEPCMTSQSNIGRVIQQNISETLTELDPTNGQLKPRLAETWEAVDGDTWRFKLRARRHVLGRHRSSTEPTSSTRWSARFQKR